MEGGSEGGKWGAGMIFTMFSSNAGGFWAKSAEICRYSLDAKKRGRVGRNEGGGQVELALFLDK